MVEAETPIVPKGKGKRPAQDEGEKGSLAAKQTPKRPRRAVHRLFNTAPRGCPYGKECIFAHQCTSCGATDDHGHLACPSIQGPSGAFKQDSRCPREDEAPLPPR
jgi:hypothetical protein